MNAALRGLGSPWRWYPSIPGDGRILFFGRDREAFGFLSNFFPSPILVGNVVWPTVEHYYQASKSDNPQYRAAVLQARTPGEAKRLGNTNGKPKLMKKSWFREHPMDLRADWEGIKHEVMDLAVKEKFFQNRELALFLSATADAELIEDSRFDAYWGEGADRTGANHLGKILMKVRAGLGES